MQVWIGPREERRWGAGQVHNEINRGRVGRVINRGGVGPVAKSTAVG